MRAAAITITPTMTTTTTEAVRRLLTWLSPAFPTGGFAYSHGLEWAIEAGDPNDAASLETWLNDILLNGAGRSDAILLRHAHEAAPDALPALAALGAALAFGAERRLETLAQGAAFIRAAAPWSGPRLAALPRDATPYPVAVGALAADNAIAADLALAAYVQNFAAALVSAAVRLIPLGQTAGLAVLAALDPTLAALIKETRAATLDDLGGACFSADIAALRHETQHTRLFRT
ncbi:MAG TPA: urease accessory UreF family protein [Acetobacteraceae bacterium]|nr:urease accessory UreF family protein [Acetobacteraceae bacterium]